MNTYQAFGLTIASEIELDEMVSCHTVQPDVTIRLGNVPDSIENVTIYSNNRVIGKDKFMIDIKGISRYYVENGNLILLEPYENALFEEVKLYLLGSCMGAILYQRRILPLHGSCINIAGHGVLLTGKSGAGKSTIASALLKKGGKLVTDDVAATRINEFQEPVVYSSYPSQKLWDDAIERIGLSGQKKSLNRVSSVFNKYSINSQTCFFDSSIPLQTIFEIIPVESAAVEELLVEEVSGTEKLNIISKNSYRRFLPQAMCIKDWHFQECISIANKVKIYRILRPLNGHLENEIADRILEKLPLAKPKIYQY